MHIRRAAGRRAVRALVALALCGCALAGVVAWVSSSGKSVLELRLAEEGSPAVMTDWWIAESHEGYLALAMFFLLLGALVAGATVAGAEWRHNTVTTLLTWEPRRLRLHGSLSAAAAILGFVISLVLQVVFLAAFLPAVIAHGTSEGTDGSFWAGLVVAMTRTSAVTAAAAVLAVALATLARNTAFAVIAVFAWMAVIENVVRSVEPPLGRWLWGENLVTVLTWSRIDDNDAGTPPLLALAVLSTYCAAIVVAGAVTFSRRDVAGS
ncbi:MAG: hypothetical protein RIE08_16435 [Acidimicrobiales bacterium]